MAKKDNGVVNIRASEFRADNGLTYFITEDGEVLRKLNPRTTTWGYKQVNLGRSGTHLVHRLVAKAFLPTDDPNLDVRHLDHDKTNNHVSNLAWGTESENAKDTRDSNYHKGQKITQEIANEIRRMQREIGYGWRKVAAERFGISTHSCSDIAKGRTWR